jgi:hypothetical protein
VRPTSHRTRVDAIVGAGGPPCPLTARPPVSPTRQDSAGGASAGRRSGIPGETISGRDRTLMRSAVQNTRSLARTAIHAMLPGHGLPAPRAIVRPCLRQSLDVARGNALRISSGRALRIECPKSSFVRRHLHGSLLCVMPYANAAERSKLCVSRASSAPRTPASQLAGRDYRNVVTPPRVTPRFLSEEALSQAISAR